MTQWNKSDKPLGGKAYGSICHLPGSRLGPGDHKLNPGQARILTEKTRDKHDGIIVQEKLDGSNVCVARGGGVLIPLGRAGYPAISSKYEQHQLFAGWLVEGVERKGVVDFLGKFVRPGKADGCYLPEISGKDAVWNWRPTTE